MKNLCLVLLFLVSLFTIPLQAQCPSGSTNLTLNNQSEVDNFGLNYPNCTVLNRNLHIQGSVTDLTPLSNLTTINGTVAINYTSLTNLDGLENLTSATGIILASNTQLSDCCGLYPFVVGGGAVNYSNNPNGCQSDAQVIAACAPAAPSCIALSSPLDGATTVSPITGLTWSAAANATGYRLNVGTTSGGTDIVNDHDNGASTTYTFGSALPYNTTIYVTITPYNATGDATGCTEESFTTAAQCPSGSVTYVTQSEVDAFATTYPNCTKLDGLQVGPNGSSSSSDIDDVSAFSNIDTIVNSLTIRNNPNLTDLSGFDALKAVEFLQVYYNDGLTSFDGLDNVGSVNSFYFIDNIALTDISALEGVIDVEAIYITGNSQLSDCCAMEPPLVQIPASLTLEISNNASGCNSIPEVLSCSGVAEWTGNTDTDWHTASNWSTLTVPTAMDSVVIPDVANDPIITAAAYAKSITLTGHLTINQSGSLEIDNSTAQGININDGMLTNHGAITIGAVSGTGTTGFFLQNNGTASNEITGTIVINNTGMTGTGSGIFVSHNAGIFDNKGSITIGNTGSINYQGILLQSDFDNQSSGTINIHNWGASKAGINIITTGTFDNYGKISVNSASNPGDLAISVGGSFKRFTNHPCALIEVLSDNSIKGDELNNAGNIIENASGNSNVKSNTGIIQNKNLGNFTVDSGTNPIHSNGFLWSGCIDNDWHKAGNWLADRVPTADDDVELRGTNTIDINSSAVANSLTIQSGTLTIASTGSLTLDGAANLGSFPACINNENGTINNNGSLIMSNAGTGFGIYNASTFNNNSGASIQIDDVSTYGFANEAAFVNSGMISIGASAAVGQYGLNNYGTFTNNAGASISIDKATAIALDNSSGIFTNAGQINIDGNNAANGLYNNDDFNNNAGGVISIDNIPDGSSSSITYGIQNEHDFNNYGTLTLGATTGAGFYGIENDFNFRNKPNAVINIDRTKETGIANLFAASFVNQSTINIGSNAPIGMAGISNEGAFVNDPSATLTVDGSSQRAIWNKSAFVNKADIAIGSISSCGSHGIDNDGIFISESGTTLQIDRSTTNAIYVWSGRFENSGAITIGANAATGLNGINNRSICTNKTGGTISIDQVSGSGLFNESGTFTNEACAEISMTQKLENTATITNDGLFSIDANTANISSNFTNNGIVETVQAFPIPNITNNEIIVEPGSGQCQTAFSNALDLGTTVDFSIAGTWYFDENLTSSAGTYSANTFAGSGFTEGTTTPVYFEISGTGCTSPDTVSMELTFDDTQAPVADVTNLPVINATCTATPTAPTAMDNCAGTITATTTTSFPITTVGTTTIAWMYDDGNGNTASQTQDVVLTCGPVCTSLSSPTNGATNVSTTTHLTWHTVSGATGYRLNVGTTSGGTDLLDNYDNGTDTTYNFASALPASATIFVTITPYSADGDATGCMEESFTTSCGAYSGTDHTWLGCTDTDWHEATNWSISTVPSATDIVVIPTAANSPIISSSSAALAKQVELLTGGQLDIQAGATLTITNAAQNCLLNRGAVNNAGTLDIDNAGINGVYNLGTFTNLSTGHITVDDCSFAGLRNLTGTFTNAGKIDIGAIASIGRYGIENSTVFNNNTGGEINIDSTSLYGLYHIAGTFTNQATITIGANGPVGTYGIQNRATFNNNTGGEINIDRSKVYGIDNNSGIFTNQATINIGAHESVGSRAIANRATFNNNTGGEINIDRSRVYGLYNFSGTFTNQATINIGAKASVGSSGILNAGTFNNNTGGEINIDNTKSRALFNIIGTFTNQATINIGAKTSVKDYGIRNAGTFNNNTGGEINIDRSTIAGLFNSNTFTNHAIINIGTNAGVGNYGIQNSDTLTNSPCAKLTVFGTLNNSDVFSNMGLLSVNTTGTHTNSALTNDGIIEYLQDNPIPNVTNNEIVLQPSSTQCLNSVANVLDLGATVDFAIASTWYFDEMLTQSAGTYTAATNTFAGAGFTEGVAAMVYFEITDGTGGCTRTASMEITFDDTEAPIADVTNLPTINAVCTANPMAPTATDNCAGTITATTMTAFPITSIGTTTLTWIYDDGNGNMAMQTQDVIVSPCGDADNDGFTIAQGDCNDNDDTIYPGAPEICGDDKDNNCDGTVDEESIVDIQRNYTTNVVCFGDTTGEIAITPTQGMAPYSITWSNGDTTDTNSNLVSGIYSVTATDMLGQCKSRNYTVRDLFPELTATIDKTFYGCATQGSTNARLKATGTGGRGQKSYLWNDGSTSRFQNFAVAGTYSVTVSDTKACTATATYSLVYPPVMTISMSSVTPNPSDPNLADVALSITGGNPDYEFSASNGATSGLTSALNYTFENLSYGMSYFFTVTDASGCQTSLNLFLQFPCNPMAIIPSISSTDESCVGYNDGSITITSVSGGSAPYQYSIDNGASYQMSNSFVNLEAASYDVVIKDNSNCISTAYTTTIGTQVPTLTYYLDSDNDGYGEMTPTLFCTAPSTSYVLMSGDCDDMDNTVYPGAPEICADGKDNNCNGVVDEESVVDIQRNYTNHVVCFGDATGEMAITVSQGTAPYSIAWNTGETSDTITNLVSGTYSVTATDMLGQCKSRSYTVRDLFPELTAAIDKTYHSCSAQGSTNARLKATGTGGRGQKSYLWNDGSTSRFQNFAAEGTYTVTVSDTKACTATATYSLVYPPIMTITMSSVTQNPSNTNLADVELTITGGNPDYEFTTSTGLSSGLTSAMVYTFTDVPFGASYTFMVADASGCQTAITEFLELPLLNENSNQYSAGLNIERNENVNGLEGQREVLLFPVPTRDVLKVDIPKAYLGARFQIFNSAGMVTKDGKFLNEFQKIETSTFANGVYFLKIYPKDFPPINLKFVVQQ